MRGCRRRDRYPGRCRCCVPRWPRVSDGSGRGAVVRPRREHRPVARRSTARLSPGCIVRWRRASSRYGDSHADQREIAMTAGHLGESEAGCHPLPPAAGMTISASSSPGSSAVEKSPVKNSDAAIQPDSRPCRRAAEVRIERQHHGGQLRRGIGVRQASADRAAIADRRMRDERHRLVEQRRIACNSSTGLDTRLTRHAADPQPAGAVRLDESELAHPLDRRAPPASPAGSSSPE